MTGIKFIVEFPPTALRNSQGRPPLFSDFEKKVVEYFTHSTSNDPDSPKVYFLEEVEGHLGGAHLSMLFEIDGEDVWEARKRLDLYLMRFYLIIFAIFHLKYPPRKVMVIQQDWQTPDDLK